MAYSPSSQAKFTLSYRRIKQEIDAKGNRGRKGEVQIGNSVWARMVGNDIALKLHATDIITYHPDGSKTFNCRGWIDSNLTRHWFREAGYRIHKKRINQWTPTMWMLHQYGGYVQYFDGMRVNSDGQLIGEPKPITKNVPNAEAKALRKRMLQVYEQDYAPHLRFIDLKENWLAETRAWPLSNEPLYGTNYFDGQHPVADPLKFIVQVLHSKYRNRYADRKPSAIFKGYLDDVYESEVKHRRLLDEVSF